MLDNLYHGREENVSQPVKCDRRALSAWRRSRELDGLGLAAVCEGACQLDPPRVVAWGLVPPSRPNFRAVPTHEFLVCVCDAVQLPPRFVEHRQLEPSITIQLPTAAHRCSTSHRHNGCGRIAEEAYRISAVALERLKTFIG